MSVSTAEQTDFHEIEPAVYYRFKQGQVVEFFCLRGRHTLTQGC